MTGGPMGGGGGGYEDTPPTPAPETTEELLACREAAIAAAVDLEASAAAAELLNSGIETPTSAGLRTRAAIERSRAAIYGVGAVLADALRAWISTGEDTTFTEESE